MKHNSKRRTVHQVSQLILLISLLLSSLGMVQPAAAFARGEGAPSETPAAPTLDTNAVTETPTPAVEAPAATETPLMPTESPGAVPPQMANPAPELSAQSSGGKTERVSVSSDGTQGNGNSGFPCCSSPVSADGRFVAFVSEATDLVIDDTNGTADIFVRDRQSGTTERVSVASDSAQGNNYSYAPSISADGRFVAFTSMATNLVTGDTNGGWHVFIHDRQSGATELLSVTSDGTQGNNSSWYPSISADGRFVAFVSLATNLVPGVTSGEEHVFVRDRQNGTTECVSVSSDGTQGNFASYSSSISADGRFVAFDSSATNLVPDDTNSQWDIFVHDRQNGTTERVSVSGGGIQGSGQSGSPSISADGRFVAFTSQANNLVSGDTNGADIFVRDRQGGTTERVSLASDGTQGSYDPYYSSISADGRFVAFMSEGALVPGDTNGKSDIFVRDRQDGTIKRVSVASDGTQGNDHSYYPSISAEGGIVAFTSMATNLVSEDTNGVYDVFVYDRSYSISGKVTDSASSPISGVSISDGNGHTVLTNSNGNYILSGFMPGIYAITPSAPGYTFNPISRAISIASGNMIGVNFIGTLATYSISGRVVDSKSGGMVGVSVSDGAGHTVSTDSSGNYTFSGLAPGVYAITPSAPGYTFNPISRAINIVSGNMTGVNFIGSLPLWTLMFYLDGDNNLNDSYVSIFNQLERAANNPNVNIAVVWDRLGAGNSFYYKVQYDTNLNKLADYTSGVNRWSKGKDGELNMGDPATLTDFIKWAKESYPAQHFALVLDDHGSGLGGAMWDDTNSNDNLTVTEISSALASATGGAYKLDVLVMNACLMGMIEDAYQVRNNIDYYVASENTQSTYSSGYFNTVNGITQSTTPLQLANLFVDGYSSDAGSHPYTMSTGSIDKLNGLVSATNSLAVELNKDMSSNAANLSNVLKDVQRFDENGDNSINQEDTYIDLYDFASLAKEKFAQQNIKDSAQALMDAVDAYVLHQSHASGNGVDKSHGVSIFFPDSHSSFYDPSKYDFAVGANWKKTLAPQSGDTPGSINWGPMLVNYFDTTQPDGLDNPIPPPLVAKSTIFDPTAISPSGMPAGSPAFTLTVNGTNFDAASRVRWGDTELVTTLVSATQLTALVPDSLLAKPGIINVFVFNSEPGGEVSLTHTFNVWEDNLPRYLYPADNTTLSAGRTSYILRWYLPPNTKLSQISKYRVQMAMDENFSQVVVDKSFNGTSLPVSGLRPDTTYYWRVRALFKNGKVGNWSTLGGTRRLVTSKTNPPGLLLPAQNSQQAKTRVNFAWSKPAGLPAGDYRYVLQYGSDSSFASGTYSEVAGLTLNYISQALPHYTPGKTIYWRVKVVSGDGKDYSDFPAPRSFVRK